MSLIKNNLISLICALAVALALAAYFLWPLPGYSAALKAQMDRQLRVSQVIDSAEHQPIEVPGVPPYKGVIAPPVIAAKTKVQDMMHRSATEIAELASTQNETGRISHTNGKIVPLLDGIPQPNYLPKAAPGIDLYAFTYAYSGPKGTFNQWISLLATGNKAVTADFDPRLAQAPDKTTVDAAWAIELQKRKAEEALYGTLPANGAGVTTADPRFVSNFINQRAAAIHMYVGPDSFQIRHLNPTSTTEADIFAAMIDCWLQGDVVHVVQGINDAALSKVDQDDQNVGRAPVKRLIHIAVGAAAEASSPVGGPAAAAAATDLPANAAAMFIGPERSGGVAEAGPSMTGRVNTDQYYVTTMDVVMDMDPSYINTFIDQLYKRNAFYTVTSVKLTMVDPFAASSNGYIYGPGQVATVDLHVEAILFRSWMEKIMPVSFGK